MIKSNLIRLFFILSILFIFFAGYKIAYAQTPSSESATEKDIQNLTDKLATKVAELRLQNNRAVGGFVTDIATNTMNIKTTDDQPYTVKLDSTLTKYYQITATGKKEIKLSDIGKGDYAIVAGVLNDTTIDANFVYIDESFVAKSGKITQVNSTDYSLSVVTADKENYTLSIETSTKQQIINIKTLEAEKVGFSKIKEGDTIHFVFKQTGQEKNNTYSAAKILILPQEYFLQ